jgi:F420-dependent oxidoreductase-like protein
MRFGVFVPQGWRRDLDRIVDPVEKFEAMTNVAKVAEESGWDSIWVYDHFHTVPEPALEATFECWTITATLVRDTSRVKVGQMVSCNGYRNPALFAKIASTVDVASHGRLYAGFGAGWHEHEWKAYGYEWVDTPERMAKFREAVEIIHKMWTQDYPEFQGKHYHIDKPINEPKGARGKIPLWLGGGGEQVTLKLVAKFAEASNFGYANPEVFAAKLDVLKRHCDNLGRDINTITKSTSLFCYLLGPGEDQSKIDVPGGQTREEFEKNVFIGTTEQFVEKIESLRAAGVDYLICYMPNVAYDQRQVKQFAAEIIPHFR